MPHHLARPEPVRRHLTPFLRRPIVLVGACLVAGVAASTAHAGCNLIPQAQPAFRGALGTLDRPYAAPGDFIDVAVRQAVCDDASPGFGFDPTQYEVTLLFTPPGEDARAVVLTTAPCANLASRLGTCGGEPGIAKNGVSCIQVNQLGDPLGMGIGFVDGIPHLRFRFPDTDALLAPDGDRRGFTGPATVAVTPAGAALPCGLVTSSCAAQAGKLGLVACVDDLYAPDGTCQPNLAGTFSHFTALPPPNDFQADCYSTNPPCTATASEIRFAVDRDGNLLFPVHWQGVLPTGSTRPVPRTLRVTVRPPVPITIPDRTFLSSFTPEGQSLPPIFEPQADPTVTTTDALTLFGTSDAPSTVLRIAQRRGICSGGDHPGAACDVDGKCGGGTCGDACVGGTHDGLACAADKDCAGGRCGALYDADAFAALVAGAGPLVVPRVAVAEPGICQAPPFGGCSSNGDCGTDPCVSYAFQAQDPVALESITNGSADVLAFTAPETLAIVDRTGDDDFGDVALTVRNRTTGETQSLGGPAGTNPFGFANCGLDGSEDSRAVVQVPVPPFRTTALATEGDVVAFAESENGEGFCDENGDTDHSDAILRVFTVPGDERTAGVTPPRAIDTALRINDQSLAVSNGKVFFRSSEAAMAKQTLTRVSVASGLPGAEADGTTYQAQLSKNGRWLVFSSDADNLIGPGADTNSAIDVFVRDLVTGTVTRMSTTAAGAQVAAPSGVVGFNGTISGDGRYVAFEDWSNNLVPGDTNVCLGSSPCADIYVRDRDADADGIYDEPGAVTLTRISVGPGGVQGTEHATSPVISANGQLVVFQSYSSNLVAGDTNGQLDIFAWDRNTGVVERIDLANNGEENDQAQTETRVYDTSDDGRYVAFDLRTTNLPDGGAFSHVGPIIDVFVRDRVAGATSQVTRYLTSSGYVTITPTQFALEPAMSGDGRWVAFQNEPDFSGQGDILLRDRTKEEAPELINVPVGVPTGPPYLCQLPDVSDDGRFVTFWSNGASLIGGFDANGSYDLFLRDRTVGSLERLTVRADGHESSGDSGPRSSTIAPDGREVMFVSGAIDLLGPAVDSNGVPDAFIRGIDAADPNGVDALLFANGRLDDTVLEVLDAPSGTVTTLCPATEVRVVNGAAAFLRPESAVGTAACLGGPLNGDADVDDTVVQYWPGSGPVQNLQKAATAIALTPTHVAAIANGALSVRALAGGGWDDTGQAADRVVACGSVFAFLTSEAAQGAILNGDGDMNDHVVQIYVPGLTPQVIDLGQAATEIVCNDQVLVFRTFEADQGSANLLGSGDAVAHPTHVMQGYDLSRPECLTVGHPADCLANSARSAKVCDLEACDPRVPYKLIGTSVKFIADECEQRGSFVGICPSPGTDINGNFQDGDLVLQIFDVHAQAVQVVGAASRAATDDPLQGGDVGSDAGTVLVTQGRCIETIGGTCSTNDQCGSGEFCEAGVCKREHRPCLTDADCPPGVFCDDSPGSVGSVAASPDSDGDGIPDHLDDCVFAADPEQTDTDGDGVGDACDLATCGDGVRTYDEACEPTDDALCPGSCVHCRCTVCANLVVDPKAKVQVKTKNEAGQLTASAVIPLGTYVDEPVTIALVDGDSPLIVRESLAALPPVGKAPFKKWVRKIKAKAGIVQVQLQKTKVAGAFKLAVKAKRWFTAAAANQPAMSSDLTVTIGTQCFRVPVTLKKD